MDKQPLLHIKCYIVTIVFGDEFDWKMMHKIIASGSPEVATSRVMELFKSEWEDQGYSVQFSGAQEVTAETVRGMMDTYGIKEKE